MIEDDIIGIQEKYQILDDFYLHISRLEDWVTFGLVYCLVVYEEDLNADLHFPLHFL